MPAGVVSALTGGGYAPEQAQQRQGDPLDAVRGAESVEEMAQAIIQVPELVMVVMQMMQMMQQGQGQQMMQGGMA